MSSSPGLPPALAIEGRLATITLRRPELANRLDDQDLATLTEHLNTVDAARDVLVLRLCAEGRHFCSGYNVDGFAANQRDPAVTFASVADRLEGLRPVTLAAINGGLYGGATDLALACDFRIGVAQAKGFVPAARLGLHFYRGGMERMVSRLGLDTAKRILLLAEPFDAAGMLASGLLTQVVADRRALDEAVESLSQTLAGMAPLALLGMKKHLNAIGHGGIDAAMFAADEAAAANSDDLREGARAWREKRPPVFHGR
ncbi:MAG: enoyl-CoA hydratase/isomerase family protein [Pigmentiphaga sp.]|nr:enoyl-CoA hydratase/isomerase family protein [Pigmentiphaga sp.]